MGRKTKKMSQQYKLRRRKQRREDREFWRKQDELRAREDYLFVKFIWKVVVPIVLAFVIGVIILWRVA